MAVEETLDEWMHTTASNHGVWKVRPVQNPVRRCALVDPGVRAPALIAPRNKIKGMAYLAIRESFARGSRGRRGSRPILTMHRRPSAKMHSGMPSARAARSAFCWPR